jgi:LemA protein
MQTELVATEDKIAASRRFFNGLVRDFNTTIQRFPAMLIAGMMGFKARNFFEMEEEEKAVPSVKDTMVE